MAHVRRMQVAVKRFANSASAKASFEREVSAATAVAAPLDQQRERERELERASRRASTLLRVLECDQPCSVMPSAASWQLEGERCALTQAGRGGWKTAAAGGGARAQRPRSAPHQPQHRRARALPRIAAGDGGAGRPAVPTRGRTCVGVLSPALRFTPSPSWREHVAGASGPGGAGAPAYIRARV